jgi:hypothetical protein
LQLCNALVHSMGSLMLGLRVGETRLNHWNCWYLVLICPRNHGTVSSSSNCPIITQLLKKFALQNDWCFMSWRLWPFPAESVQRGYSRYCMHHSHNSFCRCQDWHSFVCFKMLHSYCAFRPNDPKVCCGFLLPLQYMIFHRHATYKFPEWVHWKFCSSSP